ncbi:MAG TPA: NADH-quinone oxidoreductase subunit C, partial [Dermatophilaceae bacterium]|nr:NADH-quinone oxidoreductase subunit C [Dermatophilaceae bacterium]
MSADDLGQEVAAGATSGARTVALGMPVVIRERHGMFGATAGQDTTGYGGLTVPVVLPGGSERPYGGWFDACVDDLARALDERNTASDEAIDRVVVDRGELTIVVAREHLPVVAQALRD